LALAPPGADPDGLITLSRYGVLTLQRKFADARHVIEPFPEETLTNHPPYGPCPKAFLQGATYWFEGDTAKARPAFERARVVAEQLVRESPEDPARHAQLGIVLAGLGQKEAAIDEGKRAVELLPESQDAYDGPQMTALLAQIYAWVGEHDEAFRLLDHLLAAPNGLSVPILKLDPVWDPLHKDSRFQSLIDKYATKG
jgi:tetratricopeptide (TPR) repeat protein